ncbi:MAG: hypothetical protein NDJ92_18790 [Thermoanaerobaculia bacterium]|nr:hypothetical protein [Thermoanaerobaculia bacterium]
MTAPRDETNGRQGADEPPPLGGSWSRLYTAVLAALVLLVVAFSLITRHFS